MPAHYVATATAALWVAVTPQTMLDDVPVVRYYVPAGSVQPVEWRTAKPVQQGCPIVEDGKVVGFSLGCKQAQ